jgi:hypothetical protein
LAPAPAIALAPAITGDAVPDAIDLTELLDIDMNELAGLFALVAAHSLGRLKSAELVQAQANSPQTDRAVTRCHFAPSLTA